MQQSNSGAMGRLLPKSLLGQMLLAVALALLLAQTISAVLIYQADQRNREARLINNLAFQLVAQGRDEGRFDNRPARSLRALERTNEQAAEQIAERMAGQTAGQTEEQTGARLPGRRQQQITAFFDQAARQTAAPGVARRSERAREEALAVVLNNQNVDYNKLLVVRRAVPDPGGGRDPVLGRRATERARAIGARSMLVAGLQSAPGEPWLVARAPLPPANRGRIVTLIIQTVVLYLVLVGGLALLLRRITQPLASLAERTEGFAGTQAHSAPLALTGPADIRRLLAAHNAMEKRIASLIDEKDVMLGAIGHDLKTPLAALRVRIESVADERERARMAASIEDISGTLDDILSLARVGRPSDPLERTDLGALVASVVEEFEDMGRDVILSRNARIATKMRATWLRRALRNLIGNAVRYGDQARVAVLQEEEEAVIRIADKGPGIPEDRLLDMLEPFTRGESSRNRATGGAGLGLTLARAIAEQHGGTLTLRNRIGADATCEGLLAELRLPLTR